MKCKQKTVTLNYTQVVSKNKRNMIKGTCSVCGGKKSTFISENKTGKGLSDFLNNGISKLGDLGIELHLPADKGENVPNDSFNNQKKYSYCGPGTKFNQRVKEGYNGINELDSMCKLHNKFYNDNTDTKTRNISDIALAHRADEISRNPIYDQVQRRDAHFIAGIMKNKAKFGFEVSGRTQQS